MDTSTRGKATALLLLGRMLDLYTFLGLRAGIFVILISYFENSFGGPVCSFYV
jgi:hypothetical protein